MSESRPLTEAPEPTAARRPDFATLASRTAAFAALWAVLTEAEPAGWSIGLPAAFAAAVSSVALLPRLPWSARGIAPFAAYFAYQSLRGGIDVTRRAFDPRLPLTPGIVDYDLSLDSPLARVAMANTVSLLPGTLGADIVAGRLRVHALDAGRDLRRDLAVTERRIAALFGCELTGASPDGPARGNTRA